jgi:hypothetical protein
VIKTVRPSLADVLLPLVLVLGSKYISVFAINIIFNLDWVFSFSVSQVFTLPFVHYVNLTDLVLVNSISSIVMTVVLTVGYALALYRFQYFHENFIEPKVAASLHSKRRDYLIFSEVRAHTQITVWFTLAGLVFLLTLLEFLAGNVVLFALSANFIIVILLGSATVSDMHKKGSKKATNK